MPVACLRARRVSDTERLLDQLDLVESDGQAMPPPPQHASFAMNKTLAEVDAQLGLADVDLPHDSADTTERPFREKDDITWTIFGKPHAATLIQVSDLRPQQR